MKMHDTDSSRRALPVPRQARVRFAGFACLAVTLAGVLPASAGKATDRVGLNFAAGIRPMAAADSAGVVVASTNWNNLFGVNGTTNEVFCSDGSRSGLSVTWSDFEGDYYSRSSATNGDENMMWGYCDNRSWGATSTAFVVVTGITAVSYDVYVYFGSDNPYRRGSVGIGGFNTYFYKTDDAGNGISYPSTNYTQTTDTGTNYPQANYAVWTNLTGTGFTLTHSAVIDYANGLHGMQLIMRPPPTGMTILLD